MGAQPLMQTEIIEYKVEARHLTSVQVPEFRKELVGLARKGPRGIILDISAVESIDSACLGVIILLARLLPPPARICLMGARREIRILCEVVRINSVIGLAETRDEAIAHIHAYLSRKVKLPPPVGCGA